MPVSLRHVLDIVENYVDNKKISEFEDLIDRKLLDPKWVLENVRGAPLFMHWMITSQGTLSKGEKEYLRTRYLEMGKWAQVETNNSSDTGERSGLMSITLYVEAPVPKTS